MFAKAWMWEAYIVVEDVSWMKRRASTSRTANREIFSFPARRIAAILAEKSRQEGWMEPRFVSNVSPAYDCASCQCRLRKGTKTLSNERVAVCPASKCQKLEHIDPSKTTHICSGCGHMWNPREEEIRLEQFFLCAKCDAPVFLARHNRAIVVAQKGIIDLVKHCKNSKAKRMAAQTTKEGGHATSSGARLLQLRCIVGMNKIPNSTNVIRQFF